MIGVLHSPCRLHWGSFHMGTISAMDHWIFRKPANPGLVPPQHEQHWKSWQDVPESLLLLLSAVMHRQ